jgi:aspartate kinase
MIVMKFGGSSVANAARIRNIASIVKRKKRECPVVVVSALGGVTDGLLQAANEAARGRNPKNVLAEIIRKHYAAIDALSLRREIIGDEVEQLGRRLESMSMLGECTPKGVDLLVSFGERMSARIIAAHLSNTGMPAKAYDAYDIGMITDSNFGNADVLPQSYPRMRRKLAKLAHVPVITGFIGKDRAGNVTTLGRGGSDYTASIIGAAIGAKEIQIWTDVNGIMTADPRVVRGAKSIAVVSYGEASELAVLGAKVLHPKTILPAMDKGIPVRILNTFNPGHKGTVVLRNPGVKCRIASITCKKNIQVMNLSTPSMFQEHGFLRKVFGVFESRGVSVDMVSTSEVNVSVAIEGRHITDALKSELGKIAKVDVRSGRAKISLVGNDLIYVRGALGRMFSALKGMSIEMVSSSLSETNQSFVVKEKDADTAVRRLHATFFG